MAIPPEDQRYRYLRFEGLEYIDDDIKDFEDRFGKIYCRGIHQGLTSRMLMENKDAQWQSVYTSHASRRLFELGGDKRRISLRKIILALELHTAEEMEIARFGSYWAESARQISDKGAMSAYWRGISSEGDFLGAPPSCTHIRDPMLRFCHRLIACDIAGRSQAPEKVTVTVLFYLRNMDVGSVNIPYLLARYLRMFALRRKHGAMIYGGQFVTRLAEHFGLLTKQPDAAAGVLDVTDGALDVDDGSQAVLAPIQAPQPPPTAA
nr:hypothetical protein [Tanacetum cinerariifolium]